MKTNVELLIFRVGEIILGVNVKEIKEVLKASKVYPLPNVSDIILGNINVRGSIWILLDLGRILLKRPTEVSGKKYYLLSKDSESKIAFECDEIIDILDITAGEIQRIEDGNKKASSFFMGQVYYNNRIIPILILKKFIMSDIEKLSEIDFEEIIK